MVKKIIVPLWIIALFLVGAVFLTESSFSRSGSNLSAQLSGAGGGRLTSLCPYDQNGDGVINIVDLVTIAHVFGQRVSAGAAGDVNGDGVVNIVDLVMTARHFGANCTGQSPTKSISPSYKGKDVYIFVDIATYNSLERKIKRLGDDIKLDLGTDVIVRYGDYSSPIPIRNILKQAYNKDELLGSILIGNIPTFSRNDGLYTDWFYSALNDACPIDASGTFEISSRCTILDSYTSRNVFVGRITPPASGQPGIALIERYLDKNHAFRLGQISFPKKFLFYPSIDILQANMGVTSDENSLLENIALSLASQSRYLQSEVDMILETDYPKQKDSYLSKLKNNRYETAIINIHGSPGGQFPSGDGNLMITSDDIRDASPNIFYVELLSCSNGAFKEPNYIAGEFLFNGDTLLVTANTVVAYSLDLIGDPQYQPIYFQPLSFLNSQSPLGNLFIHDSSLFVTQVFGDPTLRLEGSAQNSSRLEVTSETIDFGKRKSNDNKSVELLIKNVGQNTASILMLPPGGLRIDNKSVTDIALAGGSTLVSQPGKSIIGFASDQTINGHFKKILIPVGETITLRFLFSPAVLETSGAVVTGRYSDTLTLFTSDITRPYLDINLKAELVD